MVPTIATVPIVTETVHVPLVAAVVVVVVVAAVVRVVWMMVVVASLPWVDVTIPL